MSGRLYTQFLDQSIMYIFGKFVFQIFLSIKNKKFKEQIKKNTNTRLNFVFYKRTGSGFHNFSFFSFLRPSYTDGDKLRRTLRMMKNAQFNVIYCTYVKYMEH